MTALFEDRMDAGLRLAHALSGLAGVDTVVLGLPRGGVPVARLVADALGAPLDVIAVRKLGSPRHPEFAVGAIGEAGVRLVDDESAGLMRLDASDLEVVERSERAELERRLLAYRAGRPRLDLEGRLAIIVDDGVATGSTATAASRAARALGAAEVVVAVPVAPAGWIASVEADGHVALATPDDFWAVSRWYARFEQTTDAQVIEALDR